MLSFFAVQKVDVNAQAQKEKEKDDQGEDGVNTYPLHLFEIMFKHEFTFV